MALGSGNLLFLFSQPLDSLGKCGRVPAKFHRLGCQLSRLLSSSLDKRKSSSRERSGDFWQLCQMAIAPSASQLRSSRPQNLRPQSQQRKGAVAAAPLAIPTIGRRDGVALLMGQSGHWGRLGTNGSPGRWVRCPLIVPHDARKSPQTGRKLALFLLGKSPAAPLIQRTGGYTAMTIGSMKCCPTDGREPIPRPSSTIVSYEQRQKAVAVRAQRQKRRAAKSRK